VTDYAKQYLDNSAAFVEKLLGSVSAVQIQSEYARTSFAGFVAQATKMAELYSNLAKSASIGFGLAMADTQGMADSQGMKP
jgi:hypothetical protein